MHRRSFKLATLLASACLFWAAADAQPAQQPNPQLQQNIRNAVNRGVAFLRRTQAKDGTWQHYAGGAIDNTVGATAWCAVALIEAGAPINGNDIQSAATFVRGKVKDLNYTYAIAAALIFLDKINQGGDAVNIKLLANKLIQGQQPGGGWTYYCPNRGGIADNSNSQFALLALWIAHRNGIDAKMTFQKAEQYFRFNQQADGGWAYQFVHGPLGATNPQMTCAGMMALAFGHATKPMAGPNLKADPAVMKAKDYLDQFMVRPFQMDEHATYFLWTLQRMCMMYGYTQFNGIDWYTWGAKIILSAQRADGGWASDPISGRNCETAWALMFLCKSNLGGLQIGGNNPVPGNVPGPNPPPGGNNNAVQPPPKKVKVEEVRAGKPGEAKALAQELRTAVNPDRIEQLLDMLTNTVGTEYTTHLADAITQVKPGVKDQVRQALRQRLSRFKKDTLQQYLETDHKELRLAVLELLPRKEKCMEAIPNIIPLLRDGDVQLSTAAHETLKKMTEQNLPRDAAAWQKWWDTSGLK